MQSGCDTTTPCAPQNMPLHRSCKDSSWWGPSDCCTQGNHTPVPVGIRAATATCHYGSVGPCHGTHQDWQPTGLCQKLQESSSVKIAVGYLESWLLAVLVAAAVLTGGDDTCEMRARAGKPYRLSRPTP